MVARGTYSELQGSGLDFTSLLKEDKDQDEQRQNTTPLSGPVSGLPHALSDNSSMSSLSSSHYSLIEGTEPLAMVGVCKALDFNWKKVFNQACIKLLMCLPAVHPLSH